MVIKFDADPQVPVEKWIASISDANKAMGEIIGKEISDLIEKEIERTWNTNYQKDVDVFASANGAFVVVTWGNDNEPPGLLNDGGELTAALPSGVERSKQVSKTLKAPALIPVFRSIEPERSWRDLRQGDVLGTIIPRNFDEQIVEQFEKIFKPEPFYRVRLRNAGFG